MIENPTPGPKMSKTQELARGIDLQREEIGLLQHENEVLQAEVARLQQEREVLLGFVRDMRRDVMLRKDIREDIDAFMGRLGEEPRR